MVLACPFDLLDEFLHKAELTHVILAKVLFAQVCGLLLTVLGSKGHTSEGNACFAEVHFMLL